MNKICKNFSIPSHTPFQALQRFTILSESFYPQFLTWDRISWEPRPTPKSRLVPWMLFSIFVALLGLHFILILIRQLVAYEKDPDINISMGLVLILVAGAFTLTTTVVFIYMFFGNELCLLLRSLKSQSKYNILHKIMGQCVPQKSVSFCTVCKN